MAKKSAPHTTPQTDSEGEVQGLNPVNYITGQSTLLVDGVAVGASVNPPLTILLSGGGVAWTGTGLDFIVSAATFLIGGVFYNSPQTDITLDPADPSLDRIDTFAVQGIGDSTGQAIAITGTPGGPPLEPQVDPTYQIRLTAVYIVAGATEPTITNENLYLENTEWTSSVTAHINAASTTNPYAGVKDIEATLAVTTNGFTLTKPAGTLSLADYGSLILQIRSKASWPAPKSILLIWQNGVTNVGTTVTIKQGTFGFDSSNVTSYQQIVIPINLFNTGASLVNKLAAQVTGGGAAIGWYIDNVVLQSITNVGGSGDFSTNTNVSVANEIVLFADTTGKLGKRATGSGVAQVDSGKLGTVVIGSGLSYDTGTHTLTASGSAVTPAALTKSDDTNVTLALGGTPTTALLQATSLTLGWAGTLAISRGGWGKVMTDPNAHRLTIWDDTDGDFQFVTIGTGLTYDHATHTINASASAQTRAVTFVCDGSGTALTTGTKSYTKIPYGGTLTGWLLIGSPSGSVTVDIFRAADGAGLPVTSIVGAGTKPALSSAVEASSTSFTSWTSTTLTAKDNLAVSLSGITSTTYVALTLYFS